MSSCGNDVHWEGVSGQGPIIVLCTIQSTMTEPLLTHINNRVLFICNSLD